MTTKKNPATPQTLNDLLTAYRAPPQPPGTFRSGASVYFRSELKPGNADDKHGPRDVSAALAAGDVLADQLGEYGYAKLQADIIRLNRYVRKHDGKLPSGGMATAKRVLRDARQAIWAIEARYGKKGSPSPVLEKPPAEAKKETAATIRRELKWLDVEPIHLNTQGYDRSGRYWGSGAALFHVTGEEPGTAAKLRQRGGTPSGYVESYVDEYVRAFDAQDARVRAVQAARQKGQPLEFIHPDHRVRSPVIGEPPKKENPRPRASNPGSKDLAIREYVKTHWGEKGEFISRVGQIADTDHGALVVLGALESVTYSTRKGAEDAGEMTDYIHDFGRALPLLAFHVCERGSCASKGKLVIVGGNYRVTERGIVG